MLIKRRRFLVGVSALAAAFGLFFALRGQAATTVSTFGDPRVIARYTVTGSAITTWTAPTLNGNVDGGYHIFGQIINAVGNDDILLGFNGAFVSNTTRTKTFRVYGLGSGNAASDSGNLAGSLSGSSTSFDCWMTDATTGKERVLQCTFTVQTAGDISYVTMQTSKWVTGQSGGLDTSANITLFQITGNANRINIGSTFKMDRTF